MQKSLLQKHLIVALDLDDRERALVVADVAKSFKAMVKVGLRLYTRCGMSILDELHERGHKVFLDLKLHDIPNTVANAVATIATHPCVHMLTIHASGGVAMIKAAVEAAKKVSGNRAKVIAVTALTSLQSMEDIGVEDDLDAWVERLTDLAIEAGAAGVVCSANEVAAMRRRHPRAILITPGIRPPGYSADDQVRVATPSTAISDGATYLVVGRPIYRAEDPMKAVEALGESL